MTTTATEQPIARMHGHGTKTHWDVEYPCCHHPSAVNLTASRADEVVAAHVCLPATEPPSDALAECRRWLYRAVYDMHAERRRRAAVLLLETLRTRCVNEVGVASLAAWLGTSPTAPEEEDETVVSQPS